MAYQIALTLGLNAVQVGIAALVLGFTSANSFIRPALLPVIIYLTYYVVELNRDHLPRKIESSMVTNQTIGLLVHYIDFGLISRWSYSAHGATSAAGGHKVFPRLSPDDKRKFDAESSLLKRLRWAWFSATTRRAPATVWECANVPYFYAGEPQRIPGRARFLFGHVVTLSMCLLFFELKSMTTPMPANEAFLRTLPFFSRLSEVTTRQIIQRAVITLVHWTFIYCMLQGMYSVQAIMSILTGGKVKEWRPLFGSPLQSYSIRQFWGVFWHQSLRRRTASPAYWFTYSFLGLPKGGFAGRYLCVLGTFFVSGLIHFVSDYAGGVPKEQVGCMRFFCIQALGILVEDYVQKAARSMTGYKSNRWTKALGYIWVILWLVWTTPSWTYPSLPYNTQGERDKILPFSIFGLLGVGVPAGAI